MAKPLIITVRVNEYAMRDGNPNIPYTPQEIAETAAQCRAAGASIIHFHARNADGSPCHAPEVYAEIVARIRERTDILIDSTLGQITVKEDENRLAHVKSMGQKSATRPDFAAVDTGSSNTDAYDARAKAFRTTNKVYLNSTETCLFLAKGMAAAGVKPHLSVWAVPFVRMVDAFLDMGGDRGAGLRAMRARRRRHRRRPSLHDARPRSARRFSAAAPPHRMDGRVQGNLFKVASTALERGGHLAPGIGDYAYPELGRPSNDELVRRIAEIGRAMGRPIATTDEARGLLGIVRG